MSRVHYKELSLCSHTVVAVGGVWVSREPADLLKKHFPAKTKVQGYVTCQFDKCRFVNELFVFYMLGVGWIVKRGGWVERELVGLCDRSFILW